MDKGAVVLELNSGNVTLLTEEGAFVRVPVRRLPGARYVGQHVDMTELKSPHYGRWVTVAAACLIFLLVIPLFKPTPVQAWVTLDGSSSLEVLLDHRFNVLEVRALNDGGRQFVDGYRQELSFSALVDSYLDWSSQKGDNTVLITSTTPTGNLDKIISRHNSEEVDVLVVEVHPEAREAAGKLGVSTGRALFVAEAGSQGINISLEQIKEGNPFTALTSAGADVEQVVSGTSDPGTQTEKIQSLPQPEQEPTGDTADNGNEPPSGKDIPPGQAGKDTPPGQEDKDTPPGQVGKDTPPGQVGKETPPGQEGKDTPPGQVDEANSSGDEDPAWAEDTDSGQEDVYPPGEITIPDQVNNTSPSQGNRSEKDEDKPPYGLKEKFLPPSNSETLTWKEEKTGPPFKDKSEQDSSSSNNGKGNDKKDDDKSNNGKDNGKDKNSKSNNGRNN